MKEIQVKRLCKVEWRVAFPITDETFGPRLKDKDGAGMQVILISTIKMVPSTLVI